MKRGGFMLLVFLAGGLLASEVRGEVQKRDIFALTETQNRL
jgi:hypothetical protein